ncbi:MAG: adenosylcobinamide-GDP ribazoletransferase [Candidatus Brocadiaceae bacterium]|nr:adenosylcobinamide-GDP ribazoletransferase [Candidatus Brocadiaceae bacterium]
MKPSTSHSVTHWFPVVGFCLGLFLSFIYLPLHFLFPPILSVAIILFISILITGAFHLDGLADTCDGLWGGRNREKRLEIMRDTHIGSFGATGLVCIIGLKYISLLGIGKLGEERQSIVVSWIHDSSFIHFLPLVPVCAALIVMSVVGRWSQVCAAGLTSYARKEPGTGTFLFESTLVKHVIYTSFFPLFLFWFFYHIKGVLIFLIIASFILSWIWYVKGKIGGMTGDTLGATNEIGEIMFLITLYVFY